MNKLRRPFLIEYPITRAVAAQIAAGIIAVGVMAYLRGAGWQMPAAALCVLWGAVAAVLTLPLGLARWWLPVQAAAPVLVWLALGLQPPAWSLGAAFAVLLAVYWNAIGEGVPLYLSNPHTWRAVERLLPGCPELCVADLGSGLGGTLFHLARARPDCRFEGFETAPLVFLVSWLRHKLAGPANLRFRYRSFWQADLGTYDAVYCFLSPVPMERLFAKARQEMKAGSLFISNTFAVPGEEPDEVVEVDDRRRTRLFVWRF